MKKFSVCLALFAVFLFAVSCGGGSKNENKNEEPDTGETVTDTDTADNSEPADDSDADSDTSDTGIQGNDDDSDSTPAQPDDGDSQPDDDSDSATEPSLPECSAESGTPCVDPVSKNIWSAKSAETTAEKAADYCKDLTEGGYKWRLPNIDELRTLIVGCDNTKTGGECEISAVNNTLAHEFWNSKSFCSDDYDVNYSVFKETDMLYSSSVRTEYGDIWGVYFLQAIVTASTDQPKGFVRCISDDISACRNNPCASAENSNGICVSGGETYTCGCNDGFEWGTTSCAKVENCNGLHSTFPCKDTDSGLTWSTIGDLASWSQAVSYCDKLDEGGFTDWRLPNIDELRTTIKNCYKTETGGECRVSEERGCLSWKYCKNQYRSLLT